LVTLNLADAQLDSDELTQAAAHYREALAAFGADVDRERVTKGLLGLGSLLVRRGDFERAATLLGAASSLTTKNSTSSVEDSPEAAALADDLNAIREALGEQALTAAWDAGRALSLEAAVQVALGSPRH
jgi:hypothetical protein